MEMTAKQALACFSVVLRDTGTKEPKVKLLCLKKKKNKTLRKFLKINFTSKATKLNIGGLI